MGAQSGKFYDASISNKLFSDFSEALTGYAQTAVYHGDALLKMAVSEAWKGLEADSGKSLLKNNETELIAEILSIQKDIEAVQTAIAEKFALEVDDAVNARIDYDVLERINNIFQGYYVDFNDNAYATLNRATTVVSKYSKYGSITMPDFSGAKGLFVDLCGGDEVAAGYLYECMDKLVKFDNEALQLIQEKELIERITNLKESLNLSVDLANQLDAVLLDIHDFHIWNMPGFLVDSSLPEMVAEAVVSIIKDIFIDLPGDAFRYIKNLIFGNNNFIEDLEGITMKDVASWFEQNSDLYGLIKVWSKDNQTMRDIFAAFDFKSNEDGTYTVDVHSYSILGHDFCWQQIGGYTDLYDIIFDTATDMERDKYVVTVETEDGDEQTYTFWFWKGDYCNLGYGGEVGIYTGDGNSEPIVWVDPKYELNMTMQIDYNGDGVIDQNAKTYDGKKTWWITNFNPNAEEEYFGENEEFSADDMTIIYTIDLTENMDIYEAWKNQTQGYGSKSEKMQNISFEDGIVTYTFSGEGMPID